MSSLSQSINSIFQSIDITNFKDIDIKQLSFKKVMNSNLTGNFVYQLQNINATLENEFMLTVSQQQINDALAQFVTKNVNEILDMKIELNDGWFRLLCTLSVKGIFTKISSDFDLVHVQFDRNRQRLVFAQKGNTEMLELHAKSYLMKIAVAKALPLFRKITKRDPLGDILKAIKLADVKENVIYIDIGRWLRANKKIMLNLHKFQVNYGYVNEEQLILKANINPRDILSADISGNLITERDNPDNSKK